MTDDINKVEEAAAQPCEQPAFKKAHIGQNIAAIRRSRGISQEYVASKMGKSQQAVSNIEFQEEVSEDVLAQIAKILGVTSEYIKNYDLERVMTNNTQIINEGGRGQIVNDGQKQSINEGGKGGFNEYTDNSQTTNSLDVIKYIIAENGRLGDQTIKEKTELIKELRAELRLVRVENKKLREEIQHLKINSVKK